MEFKTLKMSLSGVGDEGDFSGHLSTNQRDLGGDRFMPGNWSKTLSDSGGKVFLLDYHQPTRRLGALYLKEDRKGLLVDKGVLNLNTTAGREMQAELKFYHEHGLPLGMSVGYDALQYTNPKPGQRDITESKLYEGSIVTWGMNTQALVEHVKSLGNATNLEIFQALLDAAKADGSRQDIPAEPVPDHSEARTKALLREIRRAKLHIASKLL